MMDTELCLGLPGGDTVAQVTGNKRGFLETVDLKLNLNNEPESKEGSSTYEVVTSVSKEKCSCPKDPAKPPAKAQVVGWPPVRSYRKNVMVSSQKPEAAAAFVKVSMDGAPYLRKVDLKMYKSYEELSNALSDMFSSFTMGKSGGGEEGMMIDFMNDRKMKEIVKSCSDYVPSYEDKDGDWMLVGDVPWPMFVDTCKRLRLMKGSDAIGLAPRAMEKGKSKA